MSKIFNFFIVSFLIIGSFCANASLFLNTNEVLKERLSNGGQVSFYKQSASEESVVAVKFSLSNPLDKRKLSSLLKYAQAQGFELSYTSANNKHHIYLQLSNALLLPVLEEIAQQAVEQQGFDVPAIQVLGNINQQRLLGEVNKLAFLSEGSDLPAMSVKTFDLKELEIDFSSNSNAVLLALFSLCDLSDDALFDFEFKDQTFSCKENGLNNSLVDESHIAKYRTSLNRELWLKTADAEQFLNFIDSFKDNNGFELAKSFSEQLPNVSISKTYEYVELLTQKSLPTLQTDNTDAMPLSNISNYFVETQNLQDNAQLTEILIKISELNFDLCSRFNCNIIQAPMISFKQEGSKFILQYDELNTKLHSSLGVLGDFFASHSQSDTAVLSQEQITLTISSTADANIFNPLMSELAKLPVTNFNIKENTLEPRTDYQILESPEITTANGNVFLKMFFDNLANGTSYLDGSKLLYNYWFVTSLNQGPDFMIFEPNEALVGTNTYANSNITISDLAENLAYIQGLLNTKSADFELNDFLMYQQALLNRINFLKTTDSNLFNLQTSQSVVDLKALMLEKIQSLTFEQYRYFLENKLSSIKLSIELYTNKPAEIEQYMQENYPEGKIFH